MENKFQMLKNFIDKKGGEAPITTHRIEVEARKNRITPEESEHLIEYQKAHPQPAVEE